MIHRSTTTRLCFALGVLGVLGCSTTPPPEYPEAAGGQPDWVDGPSRRYREADYLTGVGRGNTRAACEHDAQAALAKRFSAHIQQASRDWMGHVSEVNEMGQVRVEGMSIDQLTQVSTDYVLRGARIAERWEDGPEIIHCLAVLERGPTARTLADEISRLDAEVDAYLREGDGAETPTARFIKYKAAMELLQRREALNAELRVVDAQGRGRPAPIAWADLVAKFSQARAQVKIGLHIQGTQSEAVQTCLAEALTEQGIEILEDASVVDLMVHGDVTVERAGDVGGTALVRATIALRLIDEAQSRTVGAFRESIKVGRREVLQSIQLAVARLCQETTPKLVARINEALSK